MPQILFQKKRRFRIDPNNPYRTRYMIFNLIEAGTKYKIEVEQYDYVLRSQVAEEKGATPEIESHSSARQLIEYMLEHVKSLTDVNNTFYQWRHGQVPLIDEKKNVLVKEAIRRRFARNLKKF